MEDIEINGDILVGEYVCHVTLGVGMVIGFNNNKIEVQFPQVKDKYLFKMDENYNDFFKFLNPDIEKTIKKSFMTDEQYEYYINDKFLSGKEFYFLQYISKQPVGTRFSEQQIEDDLNIDFSNLNIFTINIRLKRIGKLISKQDSEYLLIEYEDTEYKKDSKQVALNILENHLMLQTQIMVSSKTIKKILMKKYKSYYDKNLLIEVCKRINHKCYKPYYVDEDEYGEVFIRRAQVPKTESQEPRVKDVSIQIDGKQIYPEKFLLYVYDDLKKTLCNGHIKHESEPVTILTKSRIGTSVTFNAFYCKKCGKFYTSSLTVSKEFPLKNFPLIPLEIVSESMNLNNQSELAAYGYNASVNGPSDFERRELLATLLYNKILSKEKIISMLEWFIKFNGKNSNCVNAITKWEADLDYVRNYNIFQQRKLNVEKVNMVYHGNEIS